MFGKLKEWIEGRVEGYVLSKGLQKFVAGATVAVGGVVTAFLAKPALIPILAKLHEFGVDAGFKDGVLSLQANIETLVTALGAGGAAVALNFFFRKKDGGNAPGA